jgi:hypothetical protein
VGHTFARGAATLKSAQSGGDAWISFSATALALLDGQALKKIPIMTAIEAQSIEASNHRRFDPSTIWDDGEDGEGEDGPMITEIVTSEPEQRGEFEVYLANSSKTPAWFDGWFVAVAVASKLVSPTTWLGRLLAELSLESHDDLQRFLDIMAARINALSHEARIPKPTRSDSTRWLRRSDRNGRPGSPRSLRPIHPHGRAEVVLAMTSGFWRRWLMRPGQRGSTPRG